MTTLTIQYHYGLGQHFSHLNRYQQVQALKVSFIGQPFGIMAAVLGRNATCIMMLQLFGTTNSRRHILWATFWLSLIVNIVTIILIFSQCKDVRSIWDPVAYPGYCWRPLIQEVSSHHSFLPRRDPLMTLLSTPDLYREVRCLLCHSRSLTDPPSYQLSI